jgi:hypothetical protein
MRSVNKIQWGRVIRKPIVDQHDDPAEDDTFSDLLHPTRSYAAMRLMPPRRPTSSRK